MLGYVINISCIKIIKSTYNAFKGSKTTYIRGTNKFLQAELEAGQTEASGHREEPTEEPHQKCSEARSRRILDPRPVRLVQVEKGTLRA